ncbi:MAG TPA: NADH-quinone oxidoreductase subunit L [Acidimicrobiales bacterium]|nr:NADH-quinone oxidoreductase subunit L [Acidimicrobiales bacterium]
MLHVAFLIPLFPLAGYGILTLAGRRLGNPLAGWLATAMVGASFVVTLVVFAGLFGRAPAHRSFQQTWWTWFSVDRLHVTAGILVDPLSMTMALFVTGVSTLIHLYSIGYMEHDPQFPKFFLYLNLFVAAMLLLVLGGNLLMTFLGWEGVGVCSYFLISFWFDRPSAASAGKKAMIFNRIGDAGFLVAMFLVFERTGSLQYTTVFSRLGHVGTPSLTASALLLFLGAAGKSAQLPLYPWLADAMEGPTPVSALIHAATMVTAGVYLMCRINPILFRAPDAAHTIAIIGGITAFLGATIACAQTDIKKILAYSTISQLGYMFLAAGVGAYVAAIFLMLTHAFYKALLFLGAGSVIHAMNDEQNTKAMGGLRALMPITAGTFLVAWLSIGGVPPFSGFWSKGDVLLNTYGYSPVLYALGALTAVLTAYYIGRCYMLVFTGNARWAEARASGDGHGHVVGGPVPAGEDAASVSPTAGHGEREHGALHPHEPSWVMTLPLLVLGVASALGGLINLPFHPTLVFLERWLDPVVGKTLFNHHFSAASEIGFACIDGVLAVVGVALAVTLWRAVADRPAVEPTFLQRAWYIDFGYDRLLARTSTRFAAFTSAVVERKVIDGAVNGVAAAFRRGGGVLRRVQTGYVRNYALGVMLGLVVLLAYVVSRSVS